MTGAPALDDFLLRYAPQPPLAVDAGLLAARELIRRALAELRQVTDADLEKPWPWRGQDADVRYGLYRQYEALEEARAEVGRQLAGAPAVESPARPIVASATAARWDLHGLLAGLDDVDLDRDPANGEWTVRQTLAHIVNGQRAYGWFTAWWHARRDAPTDDYPLRVPEDVAAQLPEESTEANGSLAEIGARLDDILDLSAGAFAGLDDAGLAARTRWSGYPVDVRFRLTRWASHMREHTVQVEKTLAMVGRPTSEVDRLLRLIAAAWGRLEESLYLRPAGDGAAAAAGASAERVTRSVADESATVRQAAQRATN